MEIIYKNNEQIVIELKKLMLEKKISQRDIAEKMQIKPQGLTKILGKKNFGFEDAEKILKAIGYDLIIEFKPSCNNSNHAPEPTTKTSPTPEAPDFLPDEEYDQLPTFMQQNYKRQE